jgi:2-oxoglutarate ferredoxin oxidoreductase subunit alpha
VKSTPRPVITGEGDIGLIHFGSTSFAVDEAQQILAKDGVRTRSCRIRALPLHDEVAEFVRTCKSIFVVEQNRDGQLADIVRLKVPECATKVRTILEYGGLPMPASVIVEALRTPRKEQKEAVHAR